jgi:hypothetical protein
VLGACTFLFREDGRQGLFHTWVIAEDHQVGGRDLGLVIGTRRSVVGSIDCVADLILDRVAACTVNDQV